MIPMIEREKLNYRFSDLEPYIDAETMRVHYDVLYKKYTDNLNDLISKYGLGITKHNLEFEIHQDLGTPKFYMSAEDYLKFKHNAGGYLNHSIYFENMTPSASGIKLPDIQAIINGFGGYGKFKERFKTQSLSIFGSGWVWLTAKNEGYSTEYKIQTTKNQDNPLMFEKTNILLGMDVWEHAYFLKYKADRAAYVDGFFNLIDWNLVNERHQKANL